MKVGRTMGEGGKKGGSFYKWQERVLLLLDLTQCLDLARDTGTYAGENVVHTLFHTHPWLQVQLVNST